MHNSRKAAPALAALMVVGFLFSASASAAPAPAWRITSIATPTNFTPGNESGLDLYELHVKNEGGGYTDGSPLTLIDHLPAGVTVEELDLPLRANGSQSNEATTFCNTTETGELQTVTCTIPSELPESHPARLGPGEELRFLIHVKVASAAAGNLRNVAEIEGGGAVPAQFAGDNPAQAAAPPPGFEYFSAKLHEDNGQLLSQAGGHPYQYTTDFAINSEAAPPWSNAQYIPAGGDVKDIEVKLPPGFIGNPTVVPRCPQQDFATFTQISGPRRGFWTGTHCPASSVVGFIALQQAEGRGGIIGLPIYNLDPPKGMPAQFAFQVFSTTYYIDTRVRTGGDYGITAIFRNVTEVKRINASAVTFWGYPADSSHDAIRGDCLNQTETLPFDAVGICPSGVQEVKPFFRLPTSCAEPMDTELSFDRWNEQGDFVSESSIAPAPTGCSQVSFEPTLQARPTTNLADSPSGLHALLHIPQDEGEGPGEADLRKAEVALPKGISVNPSSANGLGSCSPAQIDLHGSGPAQCPNSAKIGTAEVRTPLLDHPLQGSIYVATPHDNPFDSLLAIYLAIDDPQSGVVVKLAGRVDADPTTGRLTTTFSDTPQLPFEDFELDFFGGAAAALKTPSTCGTYSTKSTLTPWSAPESGPPTTSTDTYAIERAPGGGSCPGSEAELPNAPSFNAGTVAPIARAFSPFVINLRREDGSQEFGSLTVSPPPGLLGKLAGVAYCPEAALAAAAAKSGNEEKASPSCPPTSEVGTVDVAAGAGPAPYHTQGAAYLTGPYKGAPLGLAIVTPATAGPYDLGTVVVRTALYVDPETTRITAVSDPIPHILQGIPLDVRTIAVRLDRPDFTLNPTNCNPSAVTGQESSLLGGNAALQSPFQVGECGTLGFKPQLLLRLKGGTERQDFPALTATLQMPEGGANIAHASVALPHSEFLAQQHIRTICTRVQFAAEHCPSGSVYGQATASSPLLDQPLSGPVYLRSSSHELPDLVADLDGQIHVALVGQIDSVHGGIRTTFTSVPDAPVSKFVLQMQGGKKGLLVNSKNICAGSNRAVVQIDAQSGKFADSKPALQVKCRKHAKKGKHQRHHGGKRRSR